MLNKAEIDNTKKWRILLLSWLCILMGNCPYF